MSLGDLWTAYKAWKTIKSSSAKVKGSGALKVLTLSRQVDQLTKEYLAYKIMSDDDLLDSIRSRLQHIKDQLGTLAATTPTFPSAGVNMKMELMQNTLDAQNTAQMAQNELSRILMDQYSVDLPSD